MIDSNTILLMVRLISLEHQVLIMHKNYCFFAFIILPHCAYNNPSGSFIILTIVEFHSHCISNS